MSNVSEKKNTTVEQVTTVDKEGFVVKMYWKPMGQ